MAIYKTVRMRIGFKNFKEFVFIDLLSDKSGTGDEEYIGDGGCCLSEAFSSYIE